MGTLMYNIKGKQGFRVGRMDDEEGDILFETALENRKSVPVRVQEYGRPFLTIEPGETRCVESRSALTSYARWNRIVFAGKTIRFTENPAWKFPFQDKLMLEVLNSCGPTGESIRIGGKFYPAEIGIPIFVPVEHDDLQWAFVARLEKKLVEKREKQGDYFIKKIIPEWTKQLRSKREIAAIEKQLFSKRAEKLAKDQEAYEKKIRSNHDE
jgi:hypothetical protein